MQVVIDAGATADEGYALSKKRGNSTPDMLWVEDYRGEDVRARLCVREFKDSQRLDTFSNTPDSWFARYQLSRCRADQDRAVCIVDISVAFMHADVAQEIIVRCPRDVVSGPQGTGFWRRKKALNGTRKASQ